MESFDTGSPDDAGQAPEQEAGGGPDPDAIAADLYDELAGYGDEAEQGYEDEEYERPSIGEIAAGQRDQSTLLDGLVEQHPAIATKAAIDAMGPIYEEAIAAYPELSGDPGLIREIYNKLGGDQAFAGALEHESVAAEYAQAFRGQGTDPLTS